MATDGQNRQLFQIMTRFPLAPAAKQMQAVEFKSTFGIRKRFKLARVLLLICSLIIRYGSQMLIFKHGQVTYLKENGSGTLGMIMSAAVLKFMYSTSFTKRR